jgi:hypothetical protein
MTTRIGKLDIKSIGGLEGLAREFAAYLAANANRIGPGCALGLYTKDKMIKAAEGFTVRIGANETQIQETSSWIDNLPWDQDGYLALAFSW